MNKLLAGLKRAWVSIPQWLGRRYHVNFVQNDLPDTLEKYQLYIVEESGYQERAALICPCGCQQTLYLNLLTDERPCWRVKLASDGNASISPSVWRKTGCHSHFWLKGGKIYWC